MHVQTSAVDDQLDVCTILRRESDLIRSNLSNRLLADIKGVLLTLVQSQTDWVRELDTVLELCGSTSHMSSQGFYFYFCFETGCSRIAVRKARGSIPGQPNVQVV